MNQKIENGKIEFKNFSQYYKTVCALKKINLSINPGQKLLVCGRTGSGKSTLINTLFRIQDAESTKGDIFIDGKNIEFYELESLRSQLTIIPQVCLIFFLNQKNTVLVRYDMHFLNR